MTDTTWASTL